MPYFATSRRSDYGQMKDAFHMEQRFNYLKLAHGAYEATLGVEKYLHECGPRRVLVAYGETTSFANERMRVLH